MPIEFRCTQCDRLLRTPDGTSGKDAKCPQCGALVRIPEASAPPPSSSEVPPQLRETMPHGDSPDRRQSTASGVPPEAAAAMNRGFSPARIDLGNVLHTTWRIYTDNLWLCVLITLPLVVVGAGQNGYAYYRHWNFEPADGLISLVLGIGSFWVTLGVLLMMLKIARGEEVDAGDLFSAGPMLLPAIGVAILVGVMFALGCCLLVIPGIILVLMFSQAILLVVDKRVGVVDALRMSMEATSGNKLTLLALYLLAVVGGAIAIAATCGLGWVFVHPFVTMLWCVSYLQMTGQGTTAGPAGSR
jgi:phage FluMu protein Com